MLTKKKGYKAKCHMNAPLGISRRLSREPSARKRQSKKSKKIKSKKKKQTKKAYRHTSAKNILQSL